MLRSNDLTLGTAVDRQELKEGTERPSPPPSSSAPTPTPTAPTWSSARGAETTLASSKQKPELRAHSPCGSSSPEAMGSNQDFRNIQAKFQASQPELGEPLRKTPKPEFNKLLKKFPQTELSEQPKKPSQSELSAVSLKPLQLQFADLPKKPPQPGVLKKLPQPEFTGLGKKPTQAELPRKPLHPELTGLKKSSQADSADLRRVPQLQFASLPKPPQSDLPNLPKKLPKPEFGELSKRSPEPEPPQEPHVPAQKLLTPELNNPAGPLVELKPKKFWHPESNEAPLRLLPAQSSTFPKKPLWPEAAGFSSKSLTQSESIEVPQTSPSKCGSSEFYSHSPQPDIRTFPKNTVQPEFNENFRKPSCPQATGCPKSPKQPMFYEVPQTPPWKSESCSAQCHSPPPDFNVFPRKHPQLQPSDLTRTASESEVCKVPKRTQQPDPNVLSKKPSQPELGHLPRTSSEPEFSSLPRKFLQPQQGKFFQPEFPKGLPRKPKLPGSVSECSLPSATVGSSPGLRVPGIPHWKSQDFQVQHLPRRRPLPSASSLGHPPAKPPLPPVTINIQSFRRAPATATAVLKTTGSSTGTPFQAQQPQHTAQNPDEIYELYDAVEATDDSILSPRGRDEMQSTQHATRRSQQEPELRKATQPQKLPATDPKLLKQTRKAEKAEEEFRKKFKFEGEIVIHTKMMIDPNAKTRRGGGKHLGIRRGEILEVIEFTSKEEILCRDPKGKYGYVPRTALLPLETEVYDDVSFADPLDMQPFPQ
ncbi:PML-RARA-regulated adapter molecule 1 [Apodemus sylvaticus]|uniref:PML-RARA-regulated adapter molecule 1 n=1 Tax=Apodemus sylvaticus TaxID=10129 RepID=UPI002242F1EF|nr:PML-RARA-regulated adapter molecule 1 [Apodemus sylvaticus]